MEKTKIKNRGLCSYRYERDKYGTNDTEYEAARLWDEYAENAEYFLADSVQNPGQGVSDRDRAVAATVIQWLGSPVGRGLLDQLYKKVFNND